MDLLVVLHVGHASNALEVILTMIGLATSLVGLVLMAWAFLRKDRRVPQRDSRHSSGRARLSALPPAVREARPPCVRQAGPQGLGCPGVASRSWGSGS